MTIKQHLAVHVNVCLICLFGFFIFIRFFLFCSILVLFRFRFVKLCCLILFAIY
jgi:hypothetical protein